MRLDQYLVLHHGFTRNKAQQLITSGLITLDRKICTKPSTPVSEHPAIVISNDRRVSWVSRSAEKLAGFLENLPVPISFTDRYCLDVGASTGGFTQVLLSLGVRHVDAVDVGTDQLHISLRSDPRVTSYEQMDIRDFAKCPPGRLSYDTIVCDASFISLHDILDSIISLASPETRIMLLYKPQFEVGRRELRKTGVPRDIKKVQEQMKVFEDVLISRDMVTLFKKESTLTGEAGNQEWVYAIQKKQ